MPRETISPRPPPSPLRPGMSSAGEPAGSGGGGVLKCACFHLPRRSKKKPATPPPLVKTKLIGGRASRMSSAADEAPVASPAAQQSPRVTFLASASLSTWWPSSPTAGPASPSSSGNVVAPRRSSSSAAPRNGLPRASSSSFSHWRRSLSSRRVTPHGGVAATRASFSFPTSPASASSSCMSTPKIPHGCQQQ